MLIHDIKATFGGIENRVSRINLPIEVLASIILADSRDASLGEGRLGKQQGGSLQSDMVTAVQGYRRFRKLLKNDGDPSGTNDRIDPAIQFNCVLSCPRQAIDSRHDGDITRPAVVCFSKSRRQRRSAGRIANNRSGLPRRQTIFAGASRRSIRQTS